MSDERIRASCPECGAHLAVPPIAIGRRVRCPKCQHAFHVQSPAEQPAASTSILDDDLISGLASGSAVEPAEVRQARATAAAVAPPAPVFESPAIPQAGRAAQSGPSWATFFVLLGRVFIQPSWTGRLCAMAIILGSVFAYLGFHEFWLRGAASEVATEMTCLEFQTAATITNRHVVLTDYVLLPDYLYESRWGKMDGAWVPAIPVEWIPERLALHFEVPVEKLETIPLEAREDAFKRLTSRDFIWKTLISFPKADSEAYLEQEYESETIDGIYMSKGFYSLDSEKQRLLKSVYPAVDLGSCLIVVAGRERSTAARATGMVAGGFAAVLCGLGWAIRTAMYESVA